MESQIKLIEEQINKRMEILQNEDPTFQRLLGQLEGIKACQPAPASEMSSNGSEEVSEVVIADFEKSIENETK